MALLQLSPPYIYVPPKLTQLNPPKTKFLPQNLNVFANRERGDDYRTLLSHLFHAKYVSSQKVGVFVGQT